MKLAAFCAVVLLFLVALTASSLRAPDSAPAPSPNPASSAAQVVIDGVPVCVFSHAGQIVAGIGRCGLEVPVLPPGPARPESPSGTVLPPGHPPIDRDGGGIGPEERRIPI